MAKILEFQQPAPRPQTPQERAAEILTAKQAVDLIIIDMVTAMLPRWVEAEWPFQQLELMANDMRYNLEETFPIMGTRGDVEALVEKLRPTWEELIREIDPSLFW